MSIHLNKIPTVAPEGTDKAAIIAETQAMGLKIATLQQTLLAEGKQSLLVVLQGMDASGKDGAVKAMFGACMPAGINVVSFKKPTPEEMAHDFLWRIHQNTPQKGHITVFNRSHYEDVLIHKVHQWINDAEAQVRYDAINAFETLLQKDAKTTVLKLYLHLSKERQLEKLQERLLDPTKNYKHGAEDWKERELWDDYMAAYELAMKTCDAPKWTIIPADKRWYRDYCVAKIVLETLDAMNPQYPVIVLTEEEKAAFQITPAVEEAFAAENKEEKCEKKKDKKEKKKHKKDEKKDKKKKKD